MARAGDTLVARRFFRFCNDVLADGEYFMHKYSPDKSLGSSWHPWVRDGQPALPIQEDETALVLWSLWHYYEITKDIEFIVFATITPDYFFPGSGVLLQRELGLEGIGAIDIRNACSGFIYALSTADAFIKSGMYKTILVVGAEIQSTALDVTDRGRNTAVIFGDGAGAAIVQASDKPGVLSTHLHSDGRFAEELYVKDPGSSRPREQRQPEQILDTTDFKVVMNGSQVFKHAVVRFMEVINEALTANNLKKEDINLLVPHQANLRISQFVQQKLQLRDDQVYNNIQRYGNTTAASIPIALSEAWSEGKLKENDLVCLAAFGSGFTWASAMIRW
jgi:3-oxoacyl-[acyl-carrier-protein] synthase-3